VTKSRWFAILCDFEGRYHVDPCGSFDEAYQTGIGAMSDGYNGVAIDGFHVVLSAGYWK
jgi:hypothetical protein